MLTAHRRRLRRYRRLQKSVAWAKYAKAAGEFLGGFVSAMRTAPRSKAPFGLLICGGTLVVVFLQFDITIKVDISLKARSGLVAETQIRPVDLRK
jgi:hypothetical protein